MWEIQTHGKWEKAGQTKKSEMALIRNDRSEGISALTVTLAYGVRIHSFFFFSKPQLQNATALKVPSISSPDFTVAPGKRSLFRQIQKNVPQALFLVVPIVKPSEYLH